VTRFELNKSWGEVIEVKVNMVDVLKKELRRGTRGTYGIGTVTDPYQSLEKQYELTRGCLNVLKSAGAKISILTKSDLVLRDLDLLRDWPGAEVGISAASLDDRVSQLVEPGAPSPARRIDALAKLSSEGVETYLMAAPVIHGLSDSEEGLRLLVGKAHAAHVPRIMWDKFNPKPMATSRMRRTLASRSLSLEQDSEENMLRIRRVLQAECN